jgi:hypothetical protein
MIDKCTLKGFTRSDFINSIAWNIRMNKINTDFIDQFKPDCIIDNNKETVEIKPNVNMWDRLSESVYKDL